MKTPNNHSKSQDSTESGLRKSVKINPGTPRTPGLSNKVLVPQSVSKLTSRISKYSIPGTGTKNLKTTAFTLVELIVVIVILAILATIAFLSFSNQSSSARDSTRLSDVANLSK